MLIFPYIDCDHVTAICSHLFILSHHPNLWHIIKDPRWWSLSKRANIDFRRAFFPSSTFRLILHLSSLLFARLFEQHCYVSHEIDSVGGWKVSFAISGPQSALGAYSNSTHESICQSYYSTTANLVVDCLSAVVTNHCWTCVFVTMVTQIFNPQKYNAHASLLYNVRFRWSDFKWG